jgi:tight adherence protein B
MKRTLFLATLTPVVIGATAVMALAQEAGSLRFASVNVENYPEIRADLMVPGDVATGDASDRLRVLQDGEPVAATVTQAAAADLHVVMLIDTTGSMGTGPMAAARDAATSFLERLPADTSVAVAGYDVGMNLISGFDATPEEHIAGIAGLRADGETAMYDAIVTALEQFEAPDEADRQAIVLLTDGEDNASTTSLEEAVEALSGSGVVLHGIEYLTSFSDEAGIRALAEASGGDVQAADDPGALVDIYDRLATDLTSSYVIRYETERSGQVELTVEYAAEDGPAPVSTTLQLPRPAPEPASDPPQPAAPAPAAPAPSDTEVVSSWSTPLLVGGVAWFLALTLLLLALFVPRERRAQLAGTSRGSAATGTHELAVMVTGAAGRTLDRRGYSRGLNAALERAGINLRPEEFAVLVACGTIAAFILGAVLSGLLGGFALALLALIAARLTVSVRSDRRQRRFADQLGDTLQLLSGSLRAGYSLMQAMDAVARDSDAPTSDEFSRLVVETRLGRSTNETLEALADRLGNEDFSWVVQAIEIHREVGGDLSEVLDNVGHTIRERDQLRRQVRSVSAEGRMSGLVLILLPIFMALWMSLTNREYIGLLFEGPVGWAMLASCVVLMTAGALWIRMLVRPKF